MPTATRHVHLTIALVGDIAKPLDEAALRHALYSWSFNHAIRTSGPAPAADAAALRWIETHSVPLGRLRDARMMRAALDLISRKQDGSPAAPSTLTRKRSAFYSVLQFAVELEYFEENPLDRVSWHPPATTDVVDRRVVVNPKQAKALLLAVDEVSPAVEAFFACLYFAGLRPAEAVNLRAADCHLPQSGWGYRLLRGSCQVAGAAWTRSGKGGEEQRSSIGQPGTPGSCRLTLSW